MKKIEMFSKKLGKNVTVKSVNGAVSVLGWCNGGWSKSGGWKVPAAK